MFIKFDTLKKIKNLYVQAMQNLQEIGLNIGLHYAETRKFQDPRRVAIYSKVEFDSQTKKQIDELFSSNYGRKIPHIWHRHYTAFTGKFDVNYFPELLFIPEFERFMNYKDTYARVLSDKNLLPCMAQTVQIVTPKILLSCAEGCYRDEKFRFLPQQEFMKRFNDVGEAFIKPSTDSSSGRNCAVINMCAGNDKLSGQTSSELVASLGDNFVVQERLRCHESLSRLYPHSVNSFRIITYRWKGEICHMPVILRIGSGGKNVDNAHAGGMFIAVDDNGALYKTAFTEFNKQYTQHPDTYVKFEGYVIPYMDKLLASAKQMHALLPQLGCVNWDFTLGVNGEPILIEANIRGGSVWLPQMAHGKGVFGNKTAEVLRWLRKMKQVPYSERERYKFGRME